MIKKLLSLVILIVSGIHSRADVITPGAYTAPDQTDNIASLTPQFFKFTVQTGSSSPDGKWALTGLTINLTAFVSAKTATNATVYLYENTAGTNYTRLSSQSTVNSQITGYSGAIDTSGTTFSLGFTGNTDFGQVGVLGSGLVNGKTYLLGLDFNTSENANAAISYTNGLTGAWASGATSYYAPGDSYATNLDLGPLGPAISTSDNYFIGLQVAAVPEPGTLILGGIAAMGGAGGWWARRRKKAAPVTEEAAA